MPWGDRESGWYLMIGILRRWGPVRCECFPLGYATCPLKLDAPKGPFQEVLLIVIKGAPSHRAPLCWWMPKSAPACVKYSLSPRHATRHPTGDAQRAGGEVPHQASHLPRMQGLHPQVDSGWDRATHSVRPFPCTTEPLTLLPLCLRILTTLVPHHCTAAWHTSKRTGWTWRRQRRTLTSASSHGKGGSLSAAGKPLPGSQPADPRCCGRGCWALPASCTEKLSQMHDACRALDVKAGGPFRRGAECDIPGK